MKGGFSMKQDIEGFLSNPFLVTLKLNGKEQKRIESILKESKNRIFNQEFDYPYSEILRKFFSQTDYKGTSLDCQNEYLLQVKKTILETLLEYDCLKYFLDEEGESEKINTLLKRGQTTAKLFKSVSSRVAFFLQQTLEMKDYEEITILITMDLKRKISKVNDDYVIQKIGGLKEIVDQVTSGVKTECYLEFDKGVSNYHSDELQAYIFAKHGYDFSPNKVDQKGFLFSYNETNDKALSLAVLNDKSVWTFNGISKRTLLPFTHLIVKYNGLKHAQKLIDYAFEQISKNSICKYLYENKLPLYLSLEPESKMLGLCIRRLENRLSSVTSNKVSELDYNGFLYPLYDGYEDKVEKGEEIFKAFINNAYKSRANEIFKLFETLETIIQDEKPIGKKISKRQLTLQMMLEGEFFGYDENKDLQKFMYGYYKNFGNQQSILGRMYYRCYIVDKLTGPIANECLYEIFFDIFSMIENKYGIKCTYTMNHELREKNYEVLKEILSNYGFKLEDTFKKNYITALLDRKYATFEEVEMFPQLEQLGDAIYELAADNIYFYNPDLELNHLNRESLVKAESQIKISQAIGFDKLYISNLHDALNTKFLDYERIEMGLGNHSGNFIADSLEMIIAAISLEFGVQKALDFSTRIILEANSNLREPQFVKFDIIELNNAVYKNSNWILRDYYKKIFPGIFSNLDYDWETRSQYELLFHAINKILLIECIGNETKEKRIRVSRDLWEGIRNEEFQFVWFYLYHGIEKTIEKYRSIVESNYRDEFTK